MKISINIFTNSTLSAPKTDIIRRTYDSFCDTFGHGYPATVWCDPKPNFKMSKYYIEDLRKHFTVVVKTESLSDGYIKAVNETDSDFMFMLEHDWQFNKPLIKNSLEEICVIMSVDEIYHMRFNKRPNVVSGWDIGLTQKDVWNNITRETCFSYCKTSVLSNNPHIIDVKTYREKCLPLLQIKPGSKGIEENLTHVGLVGAIYGPKDYPATVHHIDGRRSR